VPLAENRETPQAKRTFKKAKKVWDLANARGGRADFLGGPSRSHMTDVIKTKMTGGGGLWDLDLLAADLLLVPSSAELADPPKPTRDRQQRGFRDQQQIWSHCLLSMLSS
jgi:hypothetical protein